MLKIGKNFRYDCFYEMKGKCDGKENRKKKSGLAI